jgi:hypothetical protein
MSAELPQLERLLADAAERHYRRRRVRMPRPRLSVVAGLAAAAAAVVLAIAIFPLRSDEQSARPAADPPAALAAQYSVFAREHAPGALEAAAIDDHRNVFNLSEPVSTRLLRRFRGGGVVALVGTTKVKPAPAVCLWEQDKDLGGGSCQHLSDVLRERPWFAYGRIGRSPNEIRALVPDAVTELRMELKDGSVRDVPVENNLAYTTAGQPICRVTWTTADGRTGHERGPTRAEEATPDDPKPATCR